MPPRHRRRRLPHPAPPPEAAPAAPEPAPPSPPPPPVVHVRARLVFDAVCPACQAAIRVRPGEAAHPSLRQILKRVFRGEPWQTGVPLTCPRCGATAVVVTISL